MINKRGEKPMPGIEKINSINLYNRVKLNQNNSQDRPAQNENQIRTKITKKIEKDNYIYEDPKKAKDKNKVGIDPIKRPIRVDDSNNIFYINYNGENRTVKVEPGEYNLTELSSEIQTRVNEEFGINEVRVELTGSGSDRLIRAEDKSIYEEIDGN